MKLKKIWLTFLVASLTATSMCTTTMAATNSETTTNSTKADETKTDSTSTDTTKTTTTKLEQNNGKILTLERAISGGINNDEKVAVLCKKITAYEDSLWASSGVLDSTYFSTKYSRDDAVQQKDFLRDTITYNVTVLYQQIVVLQKSMKMNEQQLKLLNKQLKQMELKKKLGQASKLELAEAQKKVDDLTAQQVQNETTLKDYKSQFLNLTNINIDNYDSLEEDLEYKVFEYEGGVDVLIQKNIDTYMENLEKLIDYQKNHVVSIAEGASPTAPTISTVSSTEAQVAESAYNAQQKRDKLKESLKSCYADLVNLQKTMETQKENIEYEKTKLAATKVRYEKGYVSEMDMELAEFNIATLENAYEKNVYTYEQTVMILEKPWVKF